MKYTYLLALAGVVVAASTGFSQTTTPITVGDYSFETPNANGSYIAISQLNGNPTPTDSTTLAPWLVQGSGNLIDVQANSLAVQGSQVLEDESNPGPGWTGGMVLSQNVSTSFVTGDTYTLTAYAGTDAGQNPILGSYLFIGTSPSAYLTTPLLGAITGVAGSETEFTVSYTALPADAGKPIYIGYNDTASQGGANRQTELDDFALTVTTPAVPEPSSIAIAALGGFGLLGLVRRRRA